MNNLSRHREAGFTIIELLVIMVIVGIFASIAAPSWLAFLNRQRLSAAQTQAVAALREAQSNAKLQKRTWAACFHDDSSNNVVRFAVVPVNPTNAGWNCSNVVGGWQQLGGESAASSIKIDSARSVSPLPGSPGGYYDVRFRENGWLLLPTSTNTTTMNNDLDLSKITFVLRNNQNSGSSRCTFVATLLGSVRTANDSQCN